MELNVSLDDDEIYLFERVIKHLQTIYNYSAGDAVELVNAYYENFTNPASRLPHFSRHKNLFFL